MNSIVRRALAGSFTAALALAAATPASAQSAGPRWQAWVGCWTPAVAGQTVVDFKVAPVLCIAPTANPSAVELTTLGEAKVIARDTIDASGAEQRINTRNCTGAQSARWSADERRIYLKSASLCDGLQSSTSAILAMSEGGEWIEVRGVSAGGGENVRVARYRAIEIPAAALDSGVSRDKLTASVPARIAAGAPVGNAAILEAVRNAEPAVVEAWILERGQEFNLDANTLISLSDAGVPGRITDAMVAVTHPKEFQFARGGGAITTTDDDRDGRRVYGGMMSPAACDRYSRYYDAYGCNYGSYDYYRYGYNRYGSGYGYGYGYNGGYYGPAVVIVTTGSAQQQQQQSGQVVKGRGYTQTGGPSSGTASTRERSPAPSSGTASSTSSTSSSSSGSSSSSSNTSSSSGERTAKGRP